MIFKNKGKLFRAAEKFVLQGRFEQAISQYLKIIDDDPNDLSTLNIIGDLYTRLGQNQEAIRFYSRVAEQYRTFNYLPKAIAMYRKMESLAPKNLDIALTLADLYSEEGLKAQARKQYQQVATRYQVQGSQEQAIAVMQKIIKLEPDNPEVLTSLGQIFAQRNDAATAERYLLDAGEAHMRAGSIATARGVFLQALAINAKQLDALRGLLNSSLLPAEGEEALSSIQSYCGQMPADLEGKELLGLAHLKLDHFEEAQRILHQLILEDEDKYYRNMLTLAERLVSTGRLDEAVLQIEQISAALISHREQPAGIAILEKGLEGNPRHVESLLLASDLFMKSNQENAASFVLERIIQALQELGRFQEALEVAERLCQLSCASEKHYQLHKEIYAHCFPEKKYISPAEKQASFLEQQAKMKASSLTAAEETATSNPVLEYKMLVRYGMLDKARDLLIEILRANPDGKWAQEQLAALDEETGDAVSTVSPLDEETPTEESAGLSMPDWMQANHLPAAAAEPGGKVRPFVKPFTPEAKSSTSVRDSGSFSTPRSVQAPPATLKPRDTWGPRSLDFASASAESSSSPTSVDKPDLGPLAPESLREALSDEEIIEAVDSFFGVGGSSSTKLDDSSAPRVGSYESWFAEGQAKYEIGMNQEAIDCFLNALAFVNRFCQSERYMQCCVSLGSCYLQRGEGQEAIEWFKRVLQSKDLDMERILAIRYEIARGWELMGNFLQARQELEWIAQSSPNYRDVEQKIKKMNEASR